MESISADTTSRCFDTRLFGHVYFLDVFILLELLV